MKQFFLPLLIVFFFYSSLLLGQQYLNLSVDNDLYFGLDRYYSSGILISTGKLKTVMNHKGVPYKKYVHWTLGQEIYTPSNRYTIDVNEFDYPYGGWLFLERTFEHYVNPFSAWGISLKLGLTGKASLAPYLQNLYHDKILDLRDVAWEKALPQRFHLNLNLIQK
ncbi:MAG: lipid A-modifier LpxR family protein, partial [Flavobacteriaceae bacterium]